MADPKDTGDECIQIGNTYAEYRCRQCGESYVENMEDMGNGCPNCAANARLAIKQAP